MVFGLFGRSRKAPHASPPDGTVVYAVGDVHGHLTLLQRLEMQIREDMATRRPERSVAVYLGDYIDRGPASRSVIDHLLTDPLPDCECIHLLGNHEQWLLRFLSDPAAGPAWLRNGGRETLVSYGVPVPMQVETADMVAVQAAFAKALPQAHRRFFEKMPLSHREGGYFFAHAGVRPGIPLDEQSPDDLLWIREEFLYSGEDFGAVVVHGHTPAHTPEEHHNRIGVDTGAFMSGLLSAAILDRGKVSFLHS